jgi:type IV pilus assembly protein PilQ
MRHLNLILSDLVQGNLSFRIRQADWMVVLDTLTRSRGFDYRIDQGILWIASYDEVAAMLKRKGETQKIDQVKIEVMRQVMIEARIVEAERRFAQTLGAKLAIQKKPLSIETDLTASSLHGFTSGTAAVSLLGKHATQVLNIELSALEANGLGNVVSNPRVLAANNSQALIEQGTELPYQSSAGQGATKVQFRKANLRLEVKPSIQVDDQIALEVDITKDSVGLKTEQGFAIDTKHVKTHVLVESGGTVILGGIFQETDRKDTAGVPFLSDLPLIGRLFKQEAKQLDKTELLIFLTPTLVGASKPQ